MGKDRKIVALGADVKNQALFANGENIRFGPEIGDLNIVQNFDFFKKTIQKFLNKIKPDILACDAHPGYFSTQFAKDFSLQLKAYSLQLVQHHHAHIASVMFEHNSKGPVIGVSFDGTGYGTDGNIWGGEFLLVNKKGFKRLAHLEYHKMPGGEKAVLEPWRMALGILGEKALPFLKGIRAEEKEAVLKILQKKINCPLTSSAGRLFDAAAALMGLCKKASYEAEVPVRLEGMCEEKVKGAYPFAIKKEGSVYVIKTKPAFLGIVKDLKAKKDKKFIATKFHNTMREIIVKTVKKLSEMTGVTDIALSGGVFQNRFLKKTVTEKLRDPRLKSYTNVKNPVNDLNIALGQYYVSCGTGRD